MANPYHDQRGRFARKQSAVDVPEVPAQLKLDARSGFFGSNKSENRGGPKSITEENVVSGPTVAASQDIVSPWISPDAQEFHREVHAMDEGELGNLIEEARQERDMGVYNSQIDDSSNSPYLIETGSGMKLVVKPIEDARNPVDLGRPYEDWPDDFTAEDSAARELSAQLVAHQLGAPTAAYTTRTIDGERFGISKFIQTDGPADEVLFNTDEVVDQFGAREVALMDGITGNEDRHYGNLLIEADGVLAIDNDMAFPEADLPGGGNFRLLRAFQNTGQDMLSAKEKNTIFDFRRNKAAYSKQMKVWGLSDEAIDGMWQRVEDIKAEGALPDYGY